MTHRAPNKPSARGGWPHGKRRNLTGDCSSLISGLSSERSFAALACAAGVDEKTVRRWASGKNHPPLATLLHMIDIILPVGGGWLPIYDPLMAIDGGTRVGGVGEYTVRSARGAMPCLD